MSPAVALRRAAVLPGRSRAAPPADRSRATHPPPRGGASRLPTAIRATSAAPPSSPVSTRSSAAADAQALMDVAGAVLDGGEARRMRFDVASKHLREDVHGAYGEFPLTGLLQILEHPEVAAVLLAAEEVVGHAEGSVDDAEKISRAAAFHPEQDCDPEEDEECAIQETTNAFQPSFVDVGSGAGRLILAAATMRPWRSVIGVEASATLAGVASGAIAKLEAECVLPPGAVRSIHADATLGGGDVECLFDAEGCPEDPAGSGDGGDIVGAASALAGADLILAYSTAFPSPDGLRLPELSAALAAVMRPGALAVTTDKWLVGDRFEFVDMLLVQGEEGPEDQIRAFLWRARGEVPVASAKQDERGRSGVAVVAETLARIREEWMDEEDACSQNPEACAAMLESLESELAVIEGVGEMDEEEAEDDAKGGE